LLATAPGHPFIAKTIEMVVNSIRNRYTAIDIDNMLCPHQSHHPLPDLGHSHSWDLLFVTGPCILGGALNIILGKHIQSHIEAGEMNNWNGTDPTDTSPQDLRHSIPGRTIILGQNKTDMGSHRFTWIEKNMIVATTDMPDYDDRTDVKHYSDSKNDNKRIVFGMKDVYKDLIPANEIIELILKK